MKKAPNPVDRHVAAGCACGACLIGMSQEKLGEMLGLTFQQVQKYEKGTNRIGASRLHQIAQILGVPIEFFYDGAPADRDEAGFAEEAVLGLRRRFPARRPRARADQGLHRHQGSEGAPSHRRSRRKPCEAESDEPD